MSEEIRREKIEEEIREWEEFYGLVWGEEYGDYEPPVNEEDEE